MRRCIFWAIFLGLMLADAQSYAGCESIVSLGLQEWGIDARDPAYKDGVREAYCEVSGALRQEAHEAGLAVAASNIGIRKPLGKGAAANAMLAFCSTTKNDVTPKDAAYSQRSKVVRRAYLTLEQCARLRDLGVEVRHENVTQKELAVFVQPLKGRDLFVMGVQTSANVTCYGQHPREGWHGQIDARFRSSLDATSLSMVCSRAGKGTGSGGEIYAEGVVTLALQSVGNYNIYLPDTIVRTGEADEEWRAALEKLAKRVDRLVSDVTELANKVDVHAHSRSKPQGPVETPDGVMK